MRMPRAIHGWSLNVTHRLFDKIIDTFLFLLNVHVC